MTPVKLELESSTLPLSHCAPCRTAVDPDQLASNEAISVYDSTCKYKLIAGMLTVNRIINGEEYSALKYTDKC